MKTTPTDIHPALTDERLRLVRLDEVLETQRWARKNEQGQDMPHIDWLAGVIYVPWFYNKNARSGGGH